MELGKRLETVGDIEMTVRYRVLARRSANLDFTFIDMTDAGTVEKAMRSNTRMVWVETPSNPLLKLIDSSLICKQVPDLRVCAPVSRARSNQECEKQKDAGCD